MTRQELEAKAEVWGEVMSKADNGSLFVGLQGDTLIDTAKLLLEAKENLPKLAELIAKAEADEKQDRIDVVAGQVAQAITKLCEGLRVAETLGEPLIGLRWLCAGATELESVIFNPKTILRAKGEPVKRGKKGEASERKAVVGPQGEKLAINAFRIKFYGGCKEDTKSGQPGIKDDARFLALVDKIAKAHPQVNARACVAYAYAPNYKVGLDTMLDEHPDWHLEG